jgi:hypothetical protein
MQFHINFKIKPQFHNWKEKRGRLSYKSHMAMGVKTEKNAGSTHTLRHVDGSNPGGRLPFETGSICKI